MASTHRGRLMERMLRARLALGAAALFALVVVPVALAGPAKDSDGPRATASASVKKQLKKLTKKLNQLEQELAEISLQPGPQGPPGPQAPPGPQGEQGPPGPSTGPAGGDLTGNYPDPLIDSNAVNSAKVQNDTLTDDDLAASAQFNGAPAGGDLAGAYPNPDIGAVQTPIIGTGPLDAGSITPGFGSVNIGPDVFTGSGSGLTNLNASTLSSGAVPTARLSQRVDATSPVGFNPTGNSGVPILIADNLDGTGNDVTVFTDQPRTIQIIDAWSLNNLNDHSASAKWRLTVTNNMGTFPITDEVEVNGASDFHDINRVGKVELAAGTLGPTADLTIDVTAGNPHANVYILASPR